MTVSIWPASVASCSSKVSDALAEILKLTCFVSSTGFGLSLNINLGYEKNFNILKFTHTHTQSNVSLRVKCVRAFKSSTEPWH